MSESADDREFDELKTLLRARTEYEISDSSRDGPIAHQKTIDAMEKLQTEVLAQAAVSAERRSELAEAAQRGLKHLIHVATGAENDEQWQHWLSSTSSTIE